MKHKLVEFKSRQMIKLSELEEKLKEKYPDKISRVEEVIRSLVAEVYDLRSIRLPHYIRMIYLSAKEFPELLELIPKEDEIKEIR